MKIYVKPKLNSEFNSIARDAINGGSQSELSERLIELFSQIPNNTYILALGSRGYNTGYLKESATQYKWLYNDQIKSIDSYWELKDQYIVLPTKFQPSDKIEYEDDTVVVYDVSRDNQIYSGLEDYEPMKDENWRFCTELGMYFYVDYRDNVYIKWRVGT